MFGDLIRRADGHDLATPDTGTGSEVDHQVGGAHRVFVVFDHDHGIALVAEPLESCQQAVIVTRVEADRRLVENVKHSHEAAPDLSGESNSLRLPSREGWCSAIERQIFESHVGQERESSPDFLGHFSGDFVLCRIQYKAAKKNFRLVDRQGTNSGQGPLWLFGELFCGRGDCHRTGLGIEPLAVAIGAVNDIHELFERGDEGFALRPAVFFQQFGDQSYEIPAVLLRIFSGPPGESDVLVPGAPEPQESMFVCQFAPRGLGERSLAKLQFSLHRLGDTLVDVPFPAAQILPRANELDATLGK